MRRKILCARFGVSGLALLTMIAAGPALAQDAAEASAEPSDQPVIEEIVVTAEFRETNLQETPLAITAFSAENLQARGVTGSIELSNYVLSPRATPRMKAAAVAPQPAPSAAARFVGLTLRLFPLP
jgi:outer membrane receptor protein involved in Fe transport